MKPAGTLTAASGGGRDRTGAAGDGHSSAAPQRQSLAARVVIGLVRGYQLGLSPWLGARCRHLPSCSAYAIEAVGRFGVLSGGWLAVKRLGRCHPWGTSGYDPVPDLRPGGDERPGLDARAAVHDRAPREGRSPREGRRPREE